MTRLTDLMEGPMQHLTAIISFNSTTSEMVLKATTSERKSDRFFEEPKALCCKAFRMNSQTPPPRVKFSSVASKSSKTFFSAKCKLTFYKSSSFIRAHKQLFLTTPTFSLICCSLMIEGARLMAKHHNFSFPSCLHPMKIDSHFETYLLKGRKTQTTVVKGRRRNRWWRAIKSKWQRERRRAMAKSKT